VNRIKEIGGVEEDSDSVTWTHLSKGPSGLGWGDRTL